MTARIDLGRSVWTVAPLAHLRPEVASPGVAVLDTCRADDDVVVTLDTDAVVVLAGARLDVTGEIVIDVLEETLAGGVVPWRIQGKRHACSPPSAAIDTPLCG